jgi:hypothetical protein
VAAAAGARAAAVVAAGAAGEREAIMIRTTRIPAVALATVLLAWSAAAQSGARTFATPEDAVKALLDIVKAGKADDLIALFGPDSKELVESADPGTARKGREVIKIAAAEQWRLEDEAADRKTLVIGNEEWPFPVPLVKDAKGWRFDTAAGKEEIIARRIGRNELAAIDTSRAYATAQLRYALAGHDGKPAGLYATKFRSDPGKQDGLYWPTATGQKRSPLGDLLAQAGEEGRLDGQAPAKPAPFHGYYFKILTAQGAAAPGGAKSYIVKGEMSGGFALVAWPSQYDSTGVMTFIVGRDGVVSEKDLGPKTGDAARSMTTYNPDSSWRRVR